jgi:hypothetical protein
MSAAKIGAAQRYAALAIALGLMVRETCVPQSYAWGVEAQVDWYEAYADFAGERVKLQAFAMRSMASGAAFHCAYLHATRWHISGLRVSRPSAARLPANWRMRVLKLSKLKPCLKGNHT